LMVVEPMSADVGVHENAADFGDWSLIGSGGVVMAAGGMPDAPMMMRLLPGGSGSVPSTVKLTGVPGVTEKFLGESEPSICVRGGIEVWVVILRRTSTGMLDLTAPVVSL